ncbi:MAG: FAD-dependent oxidoreductase [Cyanobacteria bacterium J06635_15]
MWDVAIVGAGMAGLICGRSLQAAGYSVGLLEKSRGLGGRMATRRLHGTCADHGARYVAFEHGLLADLIQTLQTQNLLQLWPYRSYQLTAAGNLHRVAKRNLAIAPLGMNSLGKFLGEGLNVHRQQRVTALTQTPQNTWQITCEAPNAVDSLSCEAKALVLAIPAPQALALLTPLVTLNLIPADWVDVLRAVNYAACVTVMAGYPRDRVLQLDGDFDGLAGANIGWMVQGSNHPVLQWLGLDSSKRPAPPQPVVVIQSSPEFADQCIDAPDLNPSGTHLLLAAGAALGFNLAQPDWSQVHRWRYALVNQPLAGPYRLSVHTLPLLCCGDWCGGQSIGSALDSGIAAAAAINQVLAQKTLPPPQHLWRG